MRTRVVGLLLLLALGAWVDGVAGRGDPPKGLTDAEISRRLVGKWAAEEGVEGGPKVRGTTRYKDDGTLEAEGTVEAGGKSLTIRLSGTWKVADGMIIATVTKTSAPDLLPEGHVSKDRVLSIDEKALRYKTETGKESVRRRVKE